MLAKELMMRNLLPEGMTWKEFIEITVPMFIGILLFLTIIMATFSSLLAIQIFPHMIMATIILLFVWIVSTLGHFKSTKTKTVISLFGLFFAVCLLWIRELSWGAEILEIPNDGAFLLPRLLSDLGFNTFYVSNIAMYNALIMLPIIAFIGIIGITVQRKKYQ